MSKTDEETVNELMKRVEANDAGAMCVLANDYYRGGRGLLQDQERAVELWKQAAELGYSQAHFQLGTVYDQGGDVKKAKFHWETAAMAGDETARYNLGCAEKGSGNVERALKHMRIAASAGHFLAMRALLGAFNLGLESKETIDSTLAAYNNSCAEMRSEARDNFILLQH
jgi:TPR repeat protein